MSEAPVYLDSNKPEAERCVEMAAAAWKVGDLAKAERMLSKSLRLYPTMQAQQLIQELKQDVERTASREQARQEHTRKAAQEAAQERNRQEQQQHHQQPRQRPAAAAPSTPAKPTPSPSASASPLPAGAAYTVEQCESARLIISKGKDYYSVFSLKRTATESEIKSSYRKLALKFHPDKNKAPEAEEAFKVVGAAYNTLSDPNKRAHFDAYGVDEPSGGGGGGGRGASRAAQYDRAEDFSPDDLFNMFFSQAGMGQAGGRRTYTYRRQTQPRHQQQQQDDSPGAMFNQFAHFLPLLLLLLFGLLSAPGGDEQVFGLDKTPSFPVMRTTRSAGVNYYVNQNFGHRYTRDRRALDQVEYQVEAQAFKIAEDMCQKQK